MSGNLEPILATLAKFAPPDSLDKIQKAGTTEALLAELPAIHAALKNAPRADTAALIASVDAASGSSPLPLPLLVKGFLAADWLRDSRLHIVATATRWSDGRSFVLYGGDAREERTAMGMARAADELLFSKMDT